MILTFGKHKGQEMSHVPRSYITWLSQNCSILAVKQEAQQFLLEHPLEHAVAPTTYAEASKLGWMAERNYGDARERMLASRDTNGCILVFDEENDEDHTMLLRVHDNGSISDQDFSHCQTLEEAQNILVHYPSINPAHYLETVLERLQQEEDERARTLCFSSLNGKHTIRLLIWNKDSIDVCIDGVEQGNYLYRMLSKNDPRSKEAVAILEPDEDDVFAKGGWRSIGLTKERNALLETKLQELKGK